MYYGKMGWTYHDLYNLPTFQRRYYYLKLADTIKKQQEAEKAEIAKMQSSSRGAKGR